MSHSHHHHEGCCHHHEHDSCGSSHNHKQGSCCSSHEHSSCCHQSNHESHEDFAHQLLQIADEAWMELLKDKIKHHILSSCGQQLESIASVVAETNKCRWHHKIAMHKGKEEYKNKLENAIGCSSGSCKS